MIVVGIDGSTGAERALEWAAQEAVLRHRGLRIVAAWEVPAQVYAGAMVPGVAADDFKSSMREAAEAQAEQGLQAHPDLVTELIVREGSPAAVLLEEAREADLLVVGTRGLGGFRGLLLGSVSAQVAHHATCPVVIVPPRDGE